MRQSLKKNLVRGLIILIFVATTSAGIYLFQNYLQLSSNFGRSSDENISIWKGDREFTVIIFGVDDSEVNSDLRFLDAINLLHIKPNQETVSIISVDPDLNIPVATNDEIQLAPEVTTYYEYRQLYNLYLNEYESDEALYQTVNELSKELGIRIDRYIFLDKQEYRQISDLLLAQDGQDSYETLSNPSQTTTEKLRSQANFIKTVVESTKNPFYSIGILGNSLFNYQKFIDLETNLSFEETRILYQNLSDVADFNIRTDITSSNEIYIYQSKKFLDKSVFDRGLQELLRDEDIVLEQARIDVLNGVGEPGLAGRTRRLLRNHGFNVVRVDNSRDEYSVPTLYVTEPKKYPETIDELELFYPNLDIVNREYEYRPTGDMVLIVIE